VFSFAHVILSQPSPQPAGFRPYDGVLGRIVVGSAPKDLYRNYRFLELLIAAFQMAFRQEPEEAAHALVSRKTSARQHPFQLPAHTLRICGRDGHGMEYTSCFQRCANV
jgi:hypothetical protein